MDLGHSPHPSSSSQPGFAEFVILMALITSLVALSIDAMLPALSQIGDELGAQRSQDNQLIISTLILGMAFGQLIFGPVSDAMGRKIAIQIGLAIFVLGSVISMISTDMNTMLLGRLIQGMGVSGPRISSMALIRDKFRAMMISGV